MPRRSFDHHATWAVIDDAEIKWETAKAVLLATAHGDYWIPKSQVVNYSPDELYTGYQGIIRVTLWFLQTNNLDFLAEHMGPHAPRVGRADESPLTSSKALYRQLAARYHPDRSPATTAFMTDLNSLWQSVQDDLHRSTRK